MVSNGSTSVEVATCPLTTPPFHFPCSQAFFTDVVVNFSRYALNL